VTYRLPDDYFSRYVSGITAVTGNDVQRVARTYFTPESRMLLTILPRGAAQGGTEPTR